jgi:histidine ammonia-lyase
MTTTITLKPGHVDLYTLRQIEAGNVLLALDPAAREDMLKSQAAVQKIVGSGDVVYGINTGFGKLAQTIIPSERLAELQRNLVLSHSVGTGETLAPGVVRMVLATKAVSLARGHSGARPELVDALLALFNANVLPRIPAKGSVGASGDLAPLAHMACVLIGEGEATAPDGSVISGKEAMQRIDFAPFVLGPKEGLALLNGTQVSTSLALSGLFGAETVFAAGLMAGALSLEAIQGSVKPLDARIHTARGQAGQIAVAAALRTLLDGSGIVASHAHCGRVQDPYSIRCVPQVMGACLDNLCHAARVLQVEANAASDNPLVFTDNGDVISGGNFHAEPVAFAADIIALAVSEVGAISERRMALLLDSGLSGLPPFLVRDGGVNSGFMIAQVTAAALASENKSLAHPASVDSLPTSANQEDHVSMATFAARRLGDMVNNTAVVVGIEAMAAAQGIELRRGPKSSDLVEAEFARIRSKVAFIEQDRFLATDVEAMRLWALSSKWAAPLQRLLPSYAAAEHVGACLMALTAALGVDAVLLGDAIDRRYQTDWSGAASVQPLALLRPSGTEQVATAMRICHHYRVAVVPQGGMTGLAGGAIPSTNAVALSLERCTALEPVDMSEATLTVGAGATLQAVQEAALSAGFVFGVDLGARGSCQIGGNLATNAGGNGVVQYGMMREQALGLEVVLADGSVLSMLRPMRKNNTGYDLKQWFIGSEGTLGIITRATLQLRPAPQAKCTALLGLHDYASAIRVLRHMQSHFPGALAAFELMWEDFYATVLQWHQTASPFAQTYPLWVLIEVTGAEETALTEALQETLGQAMEQGDVADVVIAQSQTQARALWHIREATAEFLTHMVPISFDISLPVHHIGDYAEECQRALSQQWPLHKTLRFGHLGDGNLHLTTDANSLDPTKDKATLIRAVEEIVYGLLAARGGSVSAEHGIGTHKKDFLAVSRTPQELAAMRAVKQALDPLNLLNPGKVFDPLFDSKVLPA